MKKILLVLLLLCSHIPAFADITISLGQTVFISSGQNVTCGGGAQGGSDPVQICDCTRPDGSFGRRALVAEVVTRRSGSAAAAVCSAIGRGLAIGNCRTVAVQTNQNIYCDCGVPEGINGDRFAAVGEAFGLNGMDLLNQCRALNSGARPMNCRAK